MTKNITEAKRTPDGAVGHPDQTVGYNYVREYVPENFVPGRKTISPLKPGNLHGIFFSGSFLQRNSCCNVRPDGYIIPFDVKSYSSNRPGDF